MKPGDLAARMTALGYPVKEGTVRVWESGRPPSPENIEGLERVFGTLAPTSEGTAPGDTSTVPSELIDALRAQADAITALAQAIEAAREEQRGMNEGLAALAAEVVKAIAAREGRPA